MWHSTDREDEAAEARRLGGLRRRREKAVSGAYDFEGLDSVQSIRRTEEQVEECLADLVEVARIKTLDDLGEGRAAFARTRRWLATKGAVPAMN